MQIISLTAFSKKTAAADAAAVPFPCSPLLSSPQQAALSMYYLAGNTSICSEHTYCYMCTLYKTDMCVARHRPCPLAQIPARCVLNFDIPDTRRIGIHKRGACRHIGNRRLSRCAKSPKLRCAPCPTLYWKIETSWRALFCSELRPPASPSATCYYLPGVSMSSMQAKGERVCILFWRHFRFRFGHSLVCALVQALCLTITTKAVTLRIRRVLSSTVAVAGAGAGAVSSLSFWTAQLAPTRAQSL